MVAGNYARPYCVRVRVRENKIIFDDLIFFIIVCDVVYSSNFPLHINLMYGIARGKLTGIFTLAFNYSRY